MAFPRPTATSLLGRLRVQLDQKLPSRRALSTRSRPSPVPTPKDTRSQFRRLNDRLPRFLQKYTTPLLGAPVAHITSFLILHEVTAILPLFGLVAAFHYGNWMPDLSSGTGEENVFDEGAARMGRWLRRKGWVEAADVDMVADHELTAKDQPGKERAGVRLVLEFATAYAITKALLPLRVAASVWATPWFARAIVVPISRTARRLVGKD